MKDFSDFLNSIGSAEVEAIFADANEKANEVRAGTPLGDKTHLGNQIGIVSYTIALELLGLYHKWLSGD